MLNANCPKLTFSSWIGCGGRFLTYSRIQSFRPSKLNGEVRHMHTHKGQKLKKGELKIATGLAASSVPLTKYHLCAHSRNILIYKILLDQELPDYKPLNFKITSIEHRFHLYITWNLIDICILVSGQCFETALTETSLTYR